MKGATSMRFLSTFRHLSAALIIAAVVAVGGTVGAASSAAAASPVTSTFDFSNDHISHFHATLKFRNHTSFTLTGVRLQHLACDHRTAFADVFDQNGQLGRFSNSTDCQNTTSPPDRIFSDLGGIRWVQIRLRDCGSGLFNGCSSSWWSLKH